MYNIFILSLLLREIYLEAQGSLIPSEK